MNTQCSQNEHLLYAKHCVRVEKLKGPSLLIMLDVLESSFSLPKFRLLPCQTGFSKTKYEIHFKPQYYSL